MKRLLACREYRWFVVNALDLEVDNAEEDRPSRLADRYKLSGLGLSPAVHARLRLHVQRGHPTPRPPQTIADD